MQATHPKYEVELDSSIESSRRLAIFERTSNQFRGIVRDPETEPVRVKMSRAAVKERWFNIPKASKGAKDNWRKQVSL